MSVQLNITGMSCGHCQAAVAKALKSVPGVTEAKVDLQNGKAVVEGTPDAQSLIAAVQEEGYGASLQG